MIRAALLFFVLSSLAQASPVLPLPPPTTPGDPVIWFQPYGTLDDTTFIQIDPAPSAINTGPFVLRYDSSGPFMGEPDPRIKFGFNCDRLLAGQPSFCFVIESNYAHLTPTIHDLEAYFEYCTEAGVCKRPWMFVHTKGLPIGGETVVMEAEVVSIEGTRAAPMTVRFRPINKGQFANVSVNGSGTSVGTDAGIHYLGAKDIASGSSLTLSGNTSTSGEGAKAAAVLNIPTVTSPAQGTTEGAWTVKIAGVERTRVTPTGNVVIGNPGAIGASLLDVNGTATVKGLALRNWNIVTLVSGYATVSNTTVTANTLINCVRKSDIGIVGDSYSVVSVIGFGYGVQAMSAGFVVATDQSQLGCTLVELVP